MDTKRKYGLITAISTVVGIVIGSGVFFKSSAILEKTEGNLAYSLLAWLIGGVIMLISAYAIGIVSSRVERNNGVVDYVEESSNRFCGYLVANYLTFIYYPILVSIVCYLSANYVLVLFGLNQSLIWLFVIILFLISFITNIFSPVIAGYFQVSTTIVKVIPIFVIAIIGTIYGITTGNTYDSLISFVPSYQPDGSNTVITTSFSLLSAVLSTSFAYEGWIIATSINHEIKDSKRNLPKALIIGSFIVVLVYLLYYLGLSSVLSNEEVLIFGNNSPIVAIERLFGPYFKLIFNLIVVISCLGALNGLTMASIRGMHSIAVRNNGPKIDLFKNINPKTDTNLPSGLVGFLISLIWLGFWYLSFEGIIPSFSFDELSIAILYISYIAIYIHIMRKYHDLCFFKRFVIPILAIMCAIFLSVASILEAGFIFFLILVVTILGIMVLFYKKDV